MTDEQIMQKVDEAIKLGRRQALVEVRAEIRKNAEKHPDGEWYLNAKLIMQIIDKCRQEG